MMGKFFSSRSRASFELPLVPAAIIGTLLTVLFYGALLYGPLDNPLLKRYCLCHAVAEASVWLFFVAVVGMVIKLRNAHAQQRVTRAVAASLDQYVSDGDEVPRSQRSAWLEASWLSLPTAYRLSWIGQRVTQIIERQLKRGKHSLLETDIRDLAAADGDAQFESFALCALSRGPCPC